MLLYYSTWSQLNYATSNTAACIARGPAEVILPRVYDQHPVDNVGRAIEEGDEVIGHIYKCRRRSRSGDNVAKVANVPVGISGAPVDLIEGVEVTPSCHTVV